MFEQVAITNLAMNACKAWHLVSIEKDWLREDLSTLQNYIIPPLISSYLYFSLFSCLVFTFGFTVEPRLSGPRFSRFLDYPDFCLWSACIQTPYRLITIHISAIRTLDYPDLLFCPEAYGQSRFHCILSPICLVDLFGPCYPG